MGSPAVPLLWEIWRRGRGSVGAIAGASGLSWLIDFAERGNPPGRTPSLHNELLGLLSFVMAVSRLVERDGLILPVLRATSTECERHEQYLRAMEVDSQRTCVWRNLDHPIVEEAV